MDGGDLKNEEQFHGGEYVWLVVVSAGRDIVAFHVCMIVAACSVAEAIEKKGSGVMYHLVNSWGRNVLFDPGRSRHRLLRVTPQNLSHCRGKLIGRLPRGVMNESNGPEFLEVAIKIRNASAVECALESCSNACPSMPIGHDVIISWILSPYAHAMEVEVPCDVREGTKEWWEYLVQCGFNAFLLSLRPVFGAHSILVDKLFHEGAMHVAARTGDLLLFVFMLLEDDASTVSACPQYVVNKDGHTPLHIAAAKGHSQIFVTLAKYALSVFVGRPAFLELDPNAKQELNSWLRCPYDLLVRDRNGATAGELCGDPETQAALAELQDRWIPPFIFVQLVRQPPYARDKPNFWQLDRLVDLGMDLGWFTAERCIRLLETIGRVCNAPATVTWALLRIPHAIPHAIAVMDDINYYSPLLKRLLQNDGGRSMVMPALMDAQILDQIRVQPMDRILEAILKGPAHSDHEDKQDEAWKRQLKRCCLPQKEGGNPESLMGPLLRHGVTMVSYEEILRSFSLNASKRLISYRLQVDHLIEKHFADPAPVAIDLIKGYLWPTPVNKRATPASLAFLCVQLLGGKGKFRDMYQTLLLKWLIERYGLNPVIMRNSNGETLLHEAVRSKLIIASTWLAQNYNALSMTHGDTSGQLPIHIALESVLDDNDKQGSNLVFAVAAFTEGAMWTWFEADHPTFPTRAD